MLTVRVWAFDPDANSMVPASVGSGFRVHGSVFSVQGLGFRVLGVRVQGPEFWVEGFG